MNGEIEVVSSDMYDAYNSKQVLKKYMGWSIKISEAKGSNLWRRIVSKK